VADRPTVLDFIKFQYRIFEFVIFTR